MRAFVELHIEQGPRMEADGIDLAVVTGIVGVHRQRIAVNGAQNHAGTTPFRQRHDAGRAVARAAAELQDLVQATDQEAVATSGRWASSRAGSTSSPAARSSLSRLVISTSRSSDGRISAFRARLDEICVGEGCRAEAELLSWVPPAPMNATVIATLVQVCEELGRKPAKLWSDAGHDAAVLSRPRPRHHDLCPKLGRHQPLAAGADAG